MVAGGGGEVIATRYLAATTTNPLLTQGVEDLLTGGSYDNDEAHSTGSR